MTESDQGEGAADVSDADAVGTLGVLLRTYRRRVGLTQKQLADLSAMSVRAVRDLESGRTRSPRSNTVDLLCTGLRIGSSDRMALQAAVGRPGEEVLSRPDADPLAPPVATSTIAGRQTEVELVRDLLLDGDERAVTVVGLGGVGKTRLVVELAGILHREHGYSVLWVSRTTTAASAAASRSHPWSSLATSSATTSLAHLVGSRQTLVVLDGCDGGEQLGPVLELLPCCPRLRLLISCRSPDQGLGMVVPVPPLPVPRPPQDRDPPALMQFDSVRLLARNVRAMRPLVRLDERSAPALSGICRLLDGIPGALELAGRMALTHTLEQILDELSAGSLPSPPSFAAGSSHTDLRSSLRGAIRAVDQIGDVLRRLVEMSGPWTLEGAAEVVGREPSVVDGAVQQLVLHGLVRRHEDGPVPRFDVINTARMLLAEEDRGG